MPLRQAISLLDEAFHLLRIVPARAWAIYLAGALPLLLGVLYFVPEFQAAEGAPQLGTVAAILALLYLWFGVCRITFAGELLSVAGDDRPDYTIHSLSGHLFLHAAELVVVPLCFFAVVPFAWGVAFFRIAACNPAATLKNLIKTSARQASPAYAGSWFLIVLVLPLALVLFINLAVLSIALPNLLKTFSGYETEFTRYSGWIDNPAIWIAALGLTGIFTEALLLASLALRSFYARSETTGRDLLRNLRRIAAIVLVAACLSVGRLHASSLTPSDLNREISRVAHQSKYGWVKHLDDKPKHEQLIGFWRRIDDVYISITSAIAHGWQGIVRFFHRLIPKPSDPKPAQLKGAPARTLDWLVWILAAAALAATGILVARALRPRRPEPGITTSDDTPSVDLKNENVLASELPDEEWLRLASAYMAEGNARLAIRALYLATLAWLSQQEFLTISPFKSNAEYQSELGRRLRSRAAVDLFAENRKRFESTWYGDHDAQSHTVQAFFDDLVRLKEQAHV